MTRLARFSGCGTSSRLPTCAAPRTARAGHVGRGRGGLLVRATNEEGPSSSSSNNNSRSESGEPSSSRSALNTKGTLEKGSWDSDEYVSTLWERFKADVKQNLGAEEARMMDTIQPKDFETGNWARKLAREQLGPFLAPMGVEEDPLDFLLDLFKLMAFMQLITVGTMFYGAELLGHQDTGQAFRAASGLGLGYMLRPFFKVEQLLYPVYNWGLRLFFPSASYELPPPARSEVQTTLNKMGILIAAVFFLPQALLHWRVADCTQLVVPMGFGLFLFDVTLMIALLLKLRLL